MRKHITRWALLALVAVGLTPPRANAMGPAYFNVNGQPFSFHDVRSDLPLTYDIDTGGLGNMTHSQAEAMVTQAFQKWQSVPTASLFFHRVSASSTPPDVLAFTGTFKHVTAANVDDFFGGGAPVEVTTPVLLDSDGSITDHLFGVGASLDEIAYAEYLQFTENDGGFNQIAIILNGRAVDGKPDPDDLTVADMTRATMRAIGESLGLADSDLNDELIFDGSPANNNAIPIMHVGANVNRSTVPILGGGIEPTLDDQMSVSLLYPGANFESSTGTIQGNVFLADGVTGLQGIEVIAHKVGDPLNSAVSAISGAKFQDNGGFGTRDPKDRGAFEIHVPPGAYTIEFRTVREPVGPRLAFFPLPGGRQYATATGSTTDPNAAAPVTVSAGAPTTVNLVAGTMPAPAPQAITAVTTAHDSTQTAQLLPLSATLSGHVKQSVSGTPGQIVFDFSDPNTPGRRLQDKLEDLYAIRVPVDSILTLRLSATNNIDLGLYLIGGLPGGPMTVVPARSSYTQIVSAYRPETLQVSIGPGTWYIGVDAIDIARADDGTPKKTPQETDYTLEVNTTPTGDTTAPTRPILNQFVLGNVTDSGADASWVTDVEAATDVISGIPVQQEFGDPTLTKVHHVTATGLTPGAYADLTALSQDANANRGSIPKVYFRTADTAAATGPAKLQAAVVGTVESFVGGGVMNQDTTLVEIAIQNTGGPATGVQLSNLAASPGWKLAAPADQPLTIGSIGTNGIALAVVRLVRDPQITGTAPLATVTFTLGP